MENRGTGRPGSGGKGGAVDVRQASGHLFYC